MSTKAACMFSHHLPKAPLTTELRPEKDFKVCAAITSRSPLMINTWDKMLEEVVRQGYSLSKIAKITGISRSVLLRWKNSDKELPSYRIFQRILYFYCFLKYRKQHKNTFIKSLK